MLDATVSQLLFFALHDDISAVDARLLRHYERELRPLSQTARGCCSIRRASPIMLRGSPIGVCLGHPSFRGGARTSFRCIRGSPRLFVPPTPCAIGSDAASHNT